MSPTINPGKPIQFTFTTNMVENSKVTIFNRTTGEYAHLDDDGLPLRLNQHGKVIFDAEWFASWSVGDVVECIVSGESYASATVTLTAATGVPQKATSTATTASALGAADL